MANKKEGPPKVSYGIRVEKKVHDVVVQLGKEKVWTESLTTAMLLEWTLKQLEIAGSYDALVKTNIEGTQKRGRRVG